jgi:hypothetical protein
VQSRHFKELLRLGTRQTDARVCSGNFRDSPAMLEIASALLLFRAKLVAESIQGRQWHCDRKALTRVRWLVPETKRRSPGPSLTATRVLGSFPRTAMILEFTDHPVLSFSPFPTFKLNGH